MTGETMRDAIFLAGLLGAGCYASSEPAHGEDGPDAGVDVGSGAEVDSGCTPGPVGWPIGCDFRCNDPEAPDFRITSLGWRAPVVLTNPVLVGATLKGIDRLRTVLLVDAGADGRVTLGAGHCDEDEPWRCGLNPDGGAPTSARWSDDASDWAFMVPPAGVVDLTFVLSMIIEGMSGRFDFDVILPLRELSIEGSVSHDSNCIGVRTNDWEPSDWLPGAVLDAKLTVEDARAVQIEFPMNMSLCDLLSGSGERCDDNPAPASWEHPPDTDVDDEAAWSVNADLAAIGVVIGVAP